ncbi:competence type IV pilus minor pilin ComGF [Paenisporosarcina sp. OV554]|uniref:competence type IV pilus minor pilin ComGF n=1 Tax=Paenisporosarcina sp. OV554 TaxID=2135694 RepID=UPI000D37CE61|nr:competence type IV pilus minor pilin ComGF [Paenisporosarcina sp. OV554]PUB12654.1 competence protein ComGF [Paenisporosarcina sp. OV554]
MRHLLTSRGYTFIDAILQLSALMLFSQLILFYSVWFKQVERYFFHAEPIEWEIFSLDIESYVSTVTTMGEQLNQNGIRFVKNGEEFDIECYQSSIRKQKNRLGHEPMLTGLNSCKVQLIGDYVIIQVDFENGRNEERTYEVSISSQ